MTEFLLEITSVRKDKNDFCEYNFVTFDVVEGNPSEKEVCNLLESNNISTCNVDYNNEARSGNLSDLNFEYIVGQKIGNSFLSLYQEIHTTLIPSTLILSNNVITSKEDDGFFAVGYKAKPKENNSFYMECPNEESVWINGNDDRSVVSEKIKLYGKFEDACESVGIWLWRFKDVNLAQVYITSFEQGRGLKLIPAAEVHMVKLENNKITVNFFIKECFKKSLGEEDFSLVFHLER